MKGNEATFHLLISIVITTKGYCSSFFVQYWPKQRFCNCIKKTLQHERNQHCYGGRGEEERMIFVFPTYLSVKYMEIPIYYVSDCIYKKMNIYVTPQVKLVWIFNVLHWPLSLYLRVVLDPFFPIWGNSDFFRKIGLHQLCALMDPGLCVTKQKNRMSQFWNTTVKNGWMNERTDERTKVNL